MSLLLTQHMIWTMIMVGFTLYCERRLLRRGSQEVSSAVQKYDWWGAALGKGLASLGFLSLYAFTVQDTSTGGTLEATWLGVALLASAIGDLALIGQSDRAFLVGLSSFFCAHLAYLFAAIWIESGGGAGEESMLLLWSFFASLSLTSVATFLALRYFWSDVPSPLRVPSAAYGTVIALMVAAAFARAYTSGCMELAFGAFAFWLSDLAVAKQRFQGERLPLRGFATRLWGLPLYYLAQLILALEATV